jgi:hypothetical protein
VKIRTLHIISIIVWSIVAVLSCISIYLQLTL